MPELIAPTVRLQAAWTEAHREWGPGLHEDGFGLLPSDDVDSPVGFAAWVARLTRGTAAQPGAGAEPGSAEPVRYRWIVEGDRLLGGIALRLGRSDQVLQYGHIGYGIRPSARRRGLAGWALGRILDEAGAAGLDRVLIVCEAGNTASARTVERCGGVLEAVRDVGHGAERRYWIGLRPPGAGR
ncbi:GNAT family N-acetyltransferase [Streptacidiphilus albus]|uniref:GNAT family N-acetyltransferase n=1 Tax=Streptacidiphilus albus TaxID=105425 RepID=UPI00054B7E3C|nr:GNAT family N-acetyltransferase [Streptacidiphilus albus]